MEELQVAVGVIADAAGKFLIARRRKSVRQGGLWEFPGGKQDAGESILAALRRELREELGIDVARASPLIKIRHRYPDFAVRLHVFRIEGFSGRVAGREGQEIRWVDESDLPNFDFPTANLRIIAAIRLPAIWPILNDDFAVPESLELRFHELAAGGLKWIQIRCKKVSRERLVSSVGPLCARARHLGFKLVVNSEPEIVKQVDIAGVHIDSRLLRGYQKRPLSTDFWIGASCHHLEELRHAQRLGLDYAFLSPVLPTTTHPGIMPLGWNRFASLVDQVNIPIYALGGMKPDDLQRARDHGGQGIAGVSAFTSIGIRADPLTRR